MPREKQVGLAFYFLLIVIVIFERRHRFGPALFPDSRIRRQFTQHLRHFPDVRSHGTTARSNIVDPDVARLRRIRAHLFPSQLQRVEPIRKLRQARKIRRVLRSSKSYRLTSEITRHRLAHVFHRRQHVLGRTQTIHSHDVGPGRPCSCDDLQSFLGVFRANTLAHGSKNLELNSELFSDIVP